MLHQKSELKNVSGGSKDDRSTKNIAISQQLQFVYWARDREKKPAEFTDYTIYIYKTFDLH